MPWCEHCNRFYNPPSMLPGGECPRCGRVIAAPKRAPWHFYVLVSAATIYLGYRAFQGIEWVAHRLG